MVRSLPFVTFALLLVSLASAQPILQGEPGEPGDTAVLECDGDDCTLDRTLVVDGDVFIDNGTLSEDLVAGDAGAFANMVAGSLTVADRITLPDCPDGYAIAFPGICEQEVAAGVYDEMASVGGFWIDRYEMSIWDTPTCDGTQYGEVADDYDDALFWDNGNWDSPLYACSLEAQTPSSYLTWFQAQQACALSGKSLCSNAQWQAAAANTNVSGCNTGGLGGLEGCDSLDDPWPAGDTRCGGCESSWQTMDQVGNLWEWVADWQGHPGWNGTENLFDGDPDGDGVHDYGDDGYWAGGPDYTSMLDRGQDGSWRPLSPAIDGNGDIQGDHYGPAAFLRGGHSTSGAQAGIFALALTGGPSVVPLSAGARCCVQE